MGKVTFVVTVAPNHQFHFIVGRRVVAGQWISEDSDFGPGLIAHITMSIDQMALKSNKDKTYHAEMLVNGLHYTVRKKADSDWLTENIDTVVADQESKKRTAAVLRYQEIQANSLHHGLNGAWNSGNKEKNAGAKAALSYDTSFPLFPSDLDKQGMISTVGAEALKKIPSSTGPKNRWNLSSTRPAWSSLDAALPTVHRGPWQRGAIPG